MDYIWNREPVDSRAWDRWLGGQNLENSPLATAQYPDDHERPDPECLILYG